MHTDQILQLAIFDFDGTLVLSNQLKEAMLYQTVKFVPGGEDLMRQILSLDEIGDRHAIFSRFAQATVSQTDARKLCSEYSSILEQGMASVEKREGVDQFLDMLKENGVGLAINSQTPQRFLNSYVELLFPGKFDVVLGGHGLKKSNSEKILKAFDCRCPGSVWFFGDGIDDHEAAMHFGFEFYGFVGGSLESQIDLKLHDGFEGLHRTFKESFRA